MNNLRLQQSNYNSLAAKTKNILIIGTEIVVRNRHSI